MKSVRMVPIGFALMAAASAVAQNLLINGGFERSAPTQSELRLSSGATNLPGWTIGTGGSLYVVRGPTIGSFAAAEGVQYVDLNGHGVTLSQSFPTTVGEIYEARFSVGRFQSVVPFRLEVAVLTERSEVLTNVEAVVPLAVGWSQSTSFRFAATTPTTTLRFTDTTGTSNYDLTLDDVSVEKVTPRLSIACSQVRLCWESQTNRMYQLQFRSELTTNVWTDLGSPRVGIGATDCTEQPVGEPRRFYRIVRLP